MKFVPVKTFDSYIMANIWLGKLQQENIVCHLRDEYSVTINPVLTNAVGGIKLCVAEVQLERCLELIRVFEQDALPGCPRCGSINIQMEEPAPIDQNFFRKFLAAIQAVFAESQNPHYRCMDCDAVFLEPKTPAAPISPSICSKAS